MNIGLHVIMVRTECKKKKKKKYRLMHYKQCFKLH